MLETHVDKWVEKAVQNIKNLSRNERCWCGSNLKYKKCHFNTVKEQKYTEDQIDSEWIKHTSSKNCMYYDCGNTCKGKVIKAHSIQRKGGLALIVNNENKVGKFKIKDRKVEHKLMGWKQASTFEGFCDKHDKIFNPVEGVEFIASREQIVLLGYRTICHEIFKKRLVINSHENYILKVIDRGCSIIDQFRMQQNLQSFVLGNKIGIKELELLIEPYSEFSENLNSHEIQSCSIFFTGSIGMVVDAVY